MGIKREAETLKCSDVTAQYVKSLIGPSLSVHEWNVDNGGIVRAQIKVTIRSGLVHTKYLHITIVSPNGNWRYCREQKDGTIKTIDYGKSRLPIQDQI